MLDSVAPKKRGRPVGAIRSVYFVVAGISDGDLNIEQIQVTRGENISKDDMRNEARREFFKMFKTEPDTIKGPFLEWANVTQQTSNKRESIRIPEEEINYTKRIAQAIYKGWHVVVRYIEDENGEERSDIGRLTFKKEVSPGPKPKGKPQPTLKPISELTDIVEL